MNSEKLFQVLVTSIREILEKDDRLAAAYLLGSVLGDRMRPDSDVDIAVLPGRDAAFGELDCFHLAASLSVALRRPADVGILSGKNLVYAKEAILGGKEIYCSDRRHADTMTTALLGMYFRFQEDRREVLDAYRAR